MKNFDLENVDCHATLAMTKNVQSGRSMIEMLGVLAIIGVLSVGGIAGYSKAMMKYRINKTIEQITLIAGNVRAFFAPQRNFYGLCSSNQCSNIDGSEYWDGWELIKKARLAPDEIIEYEADGATVKQLNNAFGGPIFLWYQDKSVEGDAKLFDIEYENIPEEACVDIVSQDWSYIGVLSIARGNKQYNTPMTIDDAILLCAENSITIFHFE